MPAPHRGGAHHAPGRVAGDTTIINPLRTITGSFRSKDRISLIALIIANLVPIIGVIFAGWDAGIIVLLYWSENLIVGFYNVLKMALVPVRGSRAKRAKVGLIVFFCIHYGLFCLGHGFFVVLLVSLSGTAREGVMRVIGRLIWPFLGLFVSHGVSFVQNFILRKEYASTTLERQMGRPYGRIVLLHMAIIFAAMPTVLLGSPLPLVALLVVGKILLDLWLHGRSHRDLFAGKTESPETPE